MTPAEEMSAAAPAAGGGAASEEEAWRRVRAAWADEAEHRAYLSRFPDLEGLAVAGGRYRAALQERPDDAVAARFRDEVVRRASALALAALPRTAPAAGRAGKRLRGILAILVGALLAWAVVELLRHLGARP